MEEKVEIFLKFLVITLWKGGYPHEIFSFLISKYHQDDPEIWSPKRIVQELSQVNFIQLCDALEKSFSFPKELTESLFLILRKRMVNKLEDIIKPGDHSAKKRWQNILKTPVCLTCLADYFHRQPEDNISNWTYKVQENIKKLLITEKWHERPYEELLLDVIGK